MSNAVTNYFNKVIQGEPLPLLGGMARWQKVSELSVGNKIAITTHDKIGSSQPKQPLEMDKNGIVWDEIVSIKKVGREQVYDIEVEGTHNFIGNGIVAHNTYVSGNVGIGTSAPSYPLDVQLAGDGDVTGFTDTNGTCTINPTSTALICTSDQTRKKNIVTISNSLDLVNALRGVTFNWLGESTSDQPHIGFVAQEVEQLIPSLVSTNSQGIKSVNYLGFAPILANAIGEQQFQLIDLTGQQQTQQSSLSQLTDQIAQLVQDILSLSTRVTNLEQALASASQSWQWVNDQYRFLVRIVMDKTPVIADEDAAGFITIKANATQATVTFSQPLPYAPIVSITALESASQYYVSDVSETSFTLNLEAPSDQDKRFSWSITLASQPQTIESSEGTVNQPAANPPAANPPIESPPVVEPTQSSQPTDTEPTNPTPTTQPTATETPPATQATPTPSDTAQTPGAETPIPTPT